MDAFFASVEQRDDPSLRGKPVIVGGTPEERGVVSTASYEARKFGVHSAMPTSRALRLCPQAILIRPHFFRYEEASRHIRSIFFNYSDLVEPMSLDEAYIDVTENKMAMESATQIAIEIQTRIRTVTRLTASAGVSYNKFLAKVGSGYRKPNGLTIITPESAQEFLDRLPIGKFYGIGEATEKRMIEREIKNGFDLRQRSPEELSRWFGKAGGFYYDIVRGIDNRPIVTYYERKSLGAEHTFRKDIRSPQDIHRYLERCSARLEQEMQKSGSFARTVTLKARYENFETVTRSRTLEMPFQSAKTILKCALELLEKTEAGKRPVRLLGISLSKLIKESELLEEDSIFSSSEE